MIHSLCSNAVDHTVQLPTSALLLDRRPRGRHLARQHGVGLLGSLDGCEVAYYAITVERYLEHPGVAAICRVDRE
jgi:hypothetical protein